MGKSRNANFWKIGAPVFLPSISIYQINQKSMHTVVKVLIRYLRHSRLRNQGALFGAIRDSNATTRLSAAERGISPGIQSARWQCRNGALSGPIRRLAGTDGVGRESQRRIWGCLGCQRLDEVSQKPSTLRNGRKTAIEVRL